MKVLILIAGAWLSFLYAAHAQQKSIDFAPTHACVRMGMPLTDLGYRLSLVEVGVSNGVVAYEKHIGDNCPDLKDLPAHGVRYMFREDQLIAVAITASVVSLTDVKKEMLKVLQKKYGPATIKDGIWTWEGRYINAYFTSYESNVVFFFQKKDKATQLKQGKKPH